MRKAIIAATLAAGIIGGAVGMVPAHASNPHPTVFVGTSGNDFMVGTPGADAMFGRAGNDWMFLGNGQDIAYGGRGNWDQIRAADGHRDYVNGGPGRHDGCVVDQKDVVVNCEHVIVVNVHGDDD